MKTRIDVINDGDKNKEGLEFWLTTSIQFDAEEPVKSNDAWNHPNLVGKNNGDGVS